MATTTDYPSILARLGLPAGPLGEPVPAWQASPTGVLHGWKYCRAARAGTDLTEITVNALTRRRTCRRCRPGFLAPGAGPWAGLVEMLGGIDDEVRSFEAAATAGLAAALVTSETQLGHLDSRLDRLAVSTPARPHPEGPVGVAFREAVERLRGRVAALPDLTAAARRQRTAALSAAQTEALAADVAWAEALADLHPGDHGTLCRDLTRALGAWRAVASGLDGDELDRLDHPFTATVPRLDAARAAFDAQLAAVVRPMWFAPGDLPGRWRTAAAAHDDGIAWAYAEWEARRSESGTRLRDAVSGAYADALADAAVPAVVLLTRAFPTGRGNDVLLAGEILARSDRHDRLVVATTRLGARWLFAWARREPLAGVLQLAAGDDVFDADVAGAFLTLWERNFDAASYRRDEALALARAVTAD